jgi:N-acetylmuramoyl-L-alanine amidase
MGRLVRVRLKKASFLFFLFSTFFMQSLNELHFIQRTIIIDPSGDAKRTGRKIGDSFERGLTLQCAEKIKDFIEKHASHIKVIISRMPGDIVYDLQNASLANRLNADLFINLNFYYCKETKPTVFLYQFSYGNDFASCNQRFALHTYDQAYKINKPITDEIAVEFKKSLLHQKYQSLFAVAGVYQAPIKPLIGIIAPSIAIEAGLKTKESWVNYIEPFALAILEVVG